jgi:arylsulfatase A-like enzyme
MGHMHGDGEKFYRAVEIMDNQVKRIWDAIQYRQQQFGEEWMIVVTTDHGRDSATGKHHGGQSLRERTGWIVTNVTPNKHFTSGAASIADIMPSIAGFLQLPVPKNIAREIDGIPFTGAVAITDPAATLENGKLLISWRALQKKGKAKIWVATTNHFKTGGEDQYQLLETVKLRKEKATIDVSTLPADFYKIVIETPVNTVNRWVMKKQ